MKTYKRAPPTPPHPICFVAYFTSKVRQAVFASLWCNDPLEQRVSSPCLHLTKKGKKWDVMGIKGLARLEFISCTVQGVQLGSWTLSLWTILMGNVLKKMAF
jgi:hypothetical protein